MNVCSRCACRCVAAAACAFRCRRTAAQCCLWCPMSTSMAGGSAPLLLALPPPASPAACCTPAGAAALPSPAGVAALPGSGASTGAGCCSVADASSDRGASGGSLEVGSGCTDRVTRQYASAQRSSQQGASRPGQKQRLPRSMHSLRSRSGAGAAAQRLWVSRTGIKFAARQVQQPRQQQPLSQSHTRTNSSASRLPTVPAGRGRFAPTGGTGGTGRAAAPLGRPLGPAARAGRSRSQ